MYSYIPLRLNDNVYVPISEKLSPLAAYVQAPRRIIIALISLTMLGLLYSWSTLDYATIRQAITQPGHEKEAFIETSMNVHVGGDLDPTPIQELCASKEWTDDLIITCDFVAGGIGNVRNHILNCMRYTIEFGGSLILPNITIRNPDDIFNIYTGKQAPFSYLLDAEHFRDSLAVSCPQMKLYSTIEDFPNHAQLTPKLKLVPRSLQRILPTTGWAHPEEWHTKFHTWLNNKTTISPSTPAHVGLGRGYLEYPIHSDPLPFSTNFGKLLRFRPDTIRLASSILYSLSQKSSHPLDPSAEIMKSAFFGAHLRTEADAVKAFDDRFNNSKYEVQASLFLESAFSSNLPFVYVASGNSSEISRFKTQASLYSISVLTKSDLLSLAEREELEALAWDQQALVDFLVMIRASEFQGIGHSSFAWNIALVRHLVEEREGRGGDYLDRDALLVDELSRIYGVAWSTPQYGTCMWP